MELLGSMKILFLFLRNCHTVSISCYVEMSLSLLSLVCVGFLFCDKVRCFVSSLQLFLGS